MVCETAVSYKLYPHRVFRIQFHKNPLYSADNPSNVAKTTGDTGRYSADQVCASRCTIIKERANEFIAYILYMAQLVRIIYYQYDILM